MHNNLHNHLHNHLHNNRLSLNRGKRSRLSRWITDPNRTVFTRTYSELALLVIFYMCFSGVIIAILCLKIYGLLLLIAHYGKPWLPLDDSCLGETPGMGFRPMLHLKSPLIWYKWTKDDMYYTSYVQAIELFMQTYELVDPSLYRDCDEEDAVARAGSHHRKPCYFDLSNLGPCANTSFGYLEQQPCIYLKFNRINDWKPDCYKKANEIPDDMPAHLKQLVIAEADSKDETLWISCEGYHPFDAEHLSNISYYPKPGFKAYYFPYSGDPNYLSPIVAIKLNQAQRDILITVKCRAWAKNIAPPNLEDGSTETGSIDFQVMIGEPPSLK